MTIKSAAASVPDTYADDLAGLEAVVARGLDTFVEVGQALVAICERRLYLVAGYSTFERYLRGRWGMARRTGYDYIQAAAVVAELADVRTSAHESAPAAPRTRSQAVELARLDPVARRDLVHSLERPLSQYSTRELRARTRMNADMHLYRQRLGTAQVGDRRSPSSMAPTTSLIRKTAWIRSPQLSAAWARANSSKSSW